MSTTTFAAPAPALAPATVAARGPVRDHRDGAGRRHRGLLAVTALAVGLAIPLTGTGSAIGAPHPPSLVSTIAATSALTSPIAMGKLDV